MKNTIKRILSCLSVFAICCMANLGLPTKAISPIFSGNELGGNNTKLADHYSHYSHSSHVSHQSHYSSRY